MTRTILLSLTLLLAETAGAAPPEFRLPPPDKQPAGGGLHWVGPVQPLRTPVDGQWSWNLQGDRLWQARLRAPEAHALRLRFEDYSGAGELALHVEGREEPVAGPYRAGGPHGDGDFWSGVVIGEAVTIQYRAAGPQEPADALPFRLAAVGRVTAPLLAQSGKRAVPEARALAGCHLDVSCFPDLEDRKQPGVALLLGAAPEGLYSCTGFLINPTAPSEDRALMLTAGHCIADARQARDIALLWRYQTETCYGNPVWQEWRSQPEFTEGAELLVRGEDEYYDFALLGLDKRALLRVTGITQQGWDTRTLPLGADVLTVGHPDGDYKRVAFGTIVAHEWTGASEDSFQTVRWRLGTSEAGSSGSPILAVDRDGDPYVIGLLSGGTLEENLDTDTIWGPYCDPEFRMAFNRLGAFYERIRVYLENPDAATGSASPVLRRARVPLGMSGESVLVAQAEDGSWWLGDALVTSGATTVRASNGNTYTLVLDDGAWAAEYNIVEVTVRLGDSNFRITLTRSEDGRWWRGTTEATEGMTILTPASKRYRLSFVDGMWIATEVTG